MSKTHTPSTNVILWDAPDRDFKLRLAATQLNHRMMQRFGLHCFYHADDHRFSVSPHEDVGKSLLYGATFRVREHKLGRKGRGYGYSEDETEGTPIAVLDGCGEKIRTSFQPNALKTRAREMAHGYLAECPRIRPDLESDYRNLWKKVTDATGVPLTTLHTSDKISLAGSSWRPSIAFDGGHFEMRTAPSVVRAVIKAVLQSDDIRPVRQSHPAEIQKELRSEHRQLYRYFAQAPGEERCNLPDHYIPQVRECLTLMCDQKDLDTFNWVVDNREAIQTYAATIPNIKAKLGLL